MNAKHWIGRMGGGLLAGVFAMSMVASVAGCGLLKPKAKKQFGQECAQDLDCESLSCATQGNICTKPCTYDKDCGGDLVCRRNDDGTGQKCAKAIGLAVGGGCMVSTDCQHNECLKYVGKEDQPGICSKYCDTEADCPDNYKICTKISDSGLLKVCIPGNPTTPASARPSFSPAPRGKTPPARPARPAEPTRPAAREPAHEPARPAQPAGRQPAPGRHR